MKSLVLLGLLCSVAHAAPAAPAELPALPVSPRPKPASALPTPPRGFAWQPLDEINAHCLVPAGWFFQKGVTRVNAWSAYFVTEQPLDAQGAVVGLGLTIVPRKSLRATEGCAPTDFARGMSAAAARRFTLLDRISLPSESPERGFAVEGFGYAIPTASGRKVRVLTLVFAQDKSDTAYIATFEAPEGRWESYALLAEVMRKSLAFDETF